jgi:flagellar biosynthesis GTPase FlhF
LQQYYDAPIFQQLVGIVLVIATTAFISHYAKSIIPRLLFTAYGLYLLIEYPIPSLQTFVAIGFMLPHIVIISRFLQVQYFIFKEATVNSYYFMLTVYGKILNIFKWFKSVIEAIIVFIQTMSFSQAKQSYEKENPNQNYDYKDYYQQQDFESRFHKFYDEQEHNRHYEQYDDSNDDSDSFSDNEDDSFNDEEYSNSHQQSDDSKEEKSQQHTHQEEQTHKQSKTKQQQPKSNNPTGNPAFDHFFSKSKYEVLGVSPTMEYKEINKIYRKLAFRFHSDTGTKEDPTGLVMKQINLAHECFKAHKKGSTSHHCDFC